MIKRKTVILALVAVLFCGIVIGIVLATRSNNDEPTAYDVSVRVACRRFENGNPVSHEEDYYFPFYKDEIHIEREYDGKSYGFVVSGYTFGGSSNWEVPREGDLFTYRTYFAQIGSTEDDLNLISACERGEYVFSLYTQTRTGTHNGQLITLNERIIKLYLTIK